MESKIIILGLLVFLFLPALALAGTFQQVFNGAVTSEITLNTIVTSCGTLTPGNTYYWAGNGVSVEANTEGATTGAEEVITANLPITLEVRHEAWLYVYDPETGEKIDDYYYEKNNDAVTLFYDRDTQFGNGNEYELVEDESWVTVASEDTPLSENDKVYLAIRADSFGNSQYGGKWWVPVEIKAFVT